MNRGRKLKKDESEKFANARLDNWQGEPCDGPPTDNRNPFDKMLSVIENSWGWYDFPRL
jgi:hypothetical protein